MKTSEIATFVQTITARTVRFILCQQRSCLKHIIAYIWHVTVFITNSVAAGFGRHGMPPTTSNPDLWPSDLETGMLVASKVGNLSTKFGHAGLLRSRIVRYNNNNNNNNAICIAQIRRKQQMGCGQCPKRKAFSLALNVSIAMYAMDGRTDAYCCLPYGRGVTMKDRPNGPVTHPVIGL